MLQHSYIRFVISLVIELKCFMLDLFIISVLQYIMIVFDLLSCLQWEVRTRIRIALHQSQSWFFFHLFIFFCFVINFHYNIFYYIASGIIICQVMVCWITPLLMSCLIRSNTNLQLIPHSLSIFTRCRFKLKNKNHKLAWCNVIDGIEIKIWICPINYLWLMIYNNSICATY